MVKKIKAKAKTLLEQYTEACDYPGRLDVPAVEDALRRYVAALGIERQVVRIESMDDPSRYPSLDRTVGLILDDWRKRVGWTARDARDAMDAMAASDARAARDARDAMDARTAMDASRRFAQWCVFRGGWWWSWDTAWVATTYCGAVQLSSANVARWSGPIMDAFLAGCWQLFWTDDTLYWVAKPTVHVDRPGGRRRLHREDGPAFECDVENLYFLNGILVPAYVVVAPEMITLAEIESERNAELRRILVEKYGRARYIHDSGAEVVHQDKDASGQPRVLYRKKREGDEDLMMVHVVDGTPQPDGIFKEYTLQVPPTMRTAGEAVAWTGYETEETYKPEAET
jgi:hypothetical protein